MSIIGIITKDTETYEIEETIKKYKINEENNIIVINKEKIDNIKNVKFDYIIIFEEIEIDKAVIQIIKTSKYTLINADYKELLKSLRKIEQEKIITFGFNPEASVTIVSNENDEIILDIQKEINLTNNKKIECQELKIENNFKRKSLYKEISMKILTKMLKI